MIDVSLMIEGQDGLTWQQWQALARTAEAAGFAGVYRSDHFVNPDPPDLGSLDTWASLAWLATHTSRIHFGTLVSPVSVQHPALLARAASSIDELAGGRLILGLGAGWQPREHEMFGFQLGSIEERSRRLEEALQLVVGLLRGEAPFTFEGEYYHLREATLGQSHARAAPRILVGGNGRRRTLPLAARFADVWNGMYLTADELSATNAYLDELLRQHGRRPSDLRRTVMLGCEIGADEADLRRKLELRAWAFWREHGLISGTPRQVVDQLGQLVEHGVDEVILQWLDYDDLDGIELIGRDVLPQLARS